MRSLLLFIIFLFSIKSVNAESISIVNFHSDCLDPAQSDMIFTQLEQYFYNENSQTIDRTKFQYRSFFLTKKNNKKLSRKDIMELINVRSLDTFLICSIKKNSLNYEVTLNFYNARTGEEKYSGTMKANSSNEIYNTIIKIIEKYRINELYPSRIGFYVRGAVLPGWGHFYTGQTGKGKFFGGLFIASFTYTGICFWNFREKKRNVIEAGADSNGYYSTNTEKLISDQRKAKFSLNISLLILSVVYIANWIDMGIDPPVFQENFPENRNVSFYRYDNNYFSFNFKNEMENNSYSFNAEVKFLYKF